MATIIKNFTNSETIEVGFRKAQPCTIATGVPEIVALYQDAGSMRFQFDMTLEQAIALACALIEAVGQVQELPA